LKEKSKYTRVKVTFEVVEDLNIKEPWEFAVYYRFKNTNHIRSETLDS